jgi:hypothetical protein
MRVFVRGLGVLGLGVCDVDSIALLSAGVAEDQRRGGARQIAEPCRGRRTGAGPLLRGEM